MRSSLCAHTERSDGGNEEGAEDFFHDGDFLVNETGEENANPLLGLRTNKPLQVVPACGAAEATSTVPTFQAL